MTHEQVFLGGAPVVGFGDPPRDPNEEYLAHQKATAPARIGGLLVGAIGGAVLGNRIHKGAVGATVGTLAGGFGGALGGELLASYALRKTLPTMLPWQRVPERSVPAGNGGFRQILDASSLKAQDQYAVAIAAPGGAPIPPDQIAEIAEVAKTLPTGHSNLYPPGTSLPADWPADDDLGPNAYRVMEDVLRDVPYGTALTVPPTSVATIKMWVRSKR